MEQTINEKRAWTHISISTILMVMFSFLTVLIVKSGFFLPAYFFLFCSIFYFGYSCYSLGWEYKRISMEDSNTP